MDKIYKIIPTLFISAFFSFQTFGFEPLDSLWQTDFDEAKKIANEKNVPILVNFSGSDWCKPCIMLSRDILNTEVFLSYAKDNLVLVNIDFPRNSKNQPPPEELRKREDLAEKYNTKGLFPLVVLLSPDEKILGTTAYENISPEDYVNRIKSVLDKNKNDGGAIEYKLSGNYYLMGSSFEIAAIDSDTSNARKSILLAKEEIERIEALISSWSPESETSKINANAGISPVQVSDELFYLIKRPKKLSDISNGAFDLSFAAISSIWVFDRTEIKLPSDEGIAHSIQKINYQNILLDENEKTVFLKDPGMRIGFGAIGKGYAANMAKKIMVQNGIISGLVNAGGDLVAWGDGFNNEKWRIGIADPKGKQKAASWLEINDMAVVTSGDYERYALVNGEKYSHIIDPRTGWPVKGLTSVTIICKDAEIADGLATAVSVLGENEGLELINSLEGIECIIINSNGDFLTSNNIDLAYLKTR